MYQFSSSICDFSLMVSCFPVCLPVSDYCSSIKYVRHALRLRVWSLLPGGLLPVKVTLIWAWSPLRRSCGSLWPWLRPSLLPTSPCLVFFFVQSNSLPGWDGREGEDRACSGSPLMWVSSFGVCVLFIRHPVLWGPWN